MDLAYQLAKKKQEVWGDQTWRNKPPLLRNIYDVLQCHIPFDDDITVKWNDADFRRQYQDRHDRQKVLEDASNVASHRSLQHNRILSRLTDHANTKQGIARHKIYQNAQKRKIMFEEREDAPINFFQG